MMLLTPEQQANAMYAMAQAFLANYTPYWWALRNRTPLIGELVVVTMTRWTNPLRQVGKLVADERVLIPEWGPIETWNEVDRAEHLAGGIVGTQREWEIECLDGERMRWTNVQVIRLPTMNDR